MASGALPSSDREAGYACAIFLRLMPFHRHVDAGDRERLALHSCGVAFKLSNRFFGALGKYLELTENNHAFLADLLQKAEEAGEDGVVGVSKTVADRYDRLFMKAYGRIGRGYRKEPEGWCFDVHYHIMQDQNVYHLTPRLWLISTVKHPGGGGCCAAAAVERAQAPLFALTQLIGVHSASYARSRSRGTAQPDQS